MPLILALRTRTSITTEALEPLSRQRRSSCISQLWAKTAQQGPFRMKTETSPGELSLSLTLKETSEKTQQSRWLGDTRERKHMAFEKETDDSSRSSGVTIQISAQSGLCGQ